MNILECMGVLEKEIGKDIRKTRINNAIIGALAVGGILAVGVVFPNLLGALADLGLLGSPGKKQAVKKSITRLSERGYIRIEKGKIHLTAKGERFAALLGKGKLAPKKPKRWDKKWRVLIFDIPETRRKMRTHIRTTLKQLGFQRLQDSVWVYPYDCEDLITLFKVDMHIGKDLLYLIVDKIEYDSALRSHFKLQ